MKALALSGGGTKFIRHIAFADAAHMSKVHFDLIGGVSAGAIAALPIALSQGGVIEPLICAREIGKTLKLKTFFGSCPVNEDGGFTASGVYNLLRGDDAAGNMNNLRKMLKEVIPSKVFAQYKAGDFAEVYTLAVNFHTGAHRMFRLKDFLYSDAIEAIMASASIPFFTPPIWIHGEPYVDGGLRDHSPGEFMVKNIPGIKSLHSVYTRPRDYQVLSKENYVPKALKLLGRTIDVMNIEISKNDEFNEMALCMDRKIKLMQHYSPAIMQGVYDVNNKRLTELFNKNYWKDVERLL